MLLNLRVLRICTFHLGLTKGLSLLLNVEQYEYTKVSQADASVKVHDNLLR